MFMHGPSVWKPCTSLQGFLFGQLLLALSTVAVIQFILLRGPLGGARTETTQLREKRRAVLRRLESSSESGSRVTGTSTGVSGADLASATSAADISTVLALLDGELLDVLKYAPGRNPAETCNWLNVLIAQLLQAVRMNVPLHGYLHSQLDLALNTLLPTLDKRMLDMNTSNLNEELNTDFLNPELLGRFLSPVVVTAVELGAGYPVLSNARVSYSETGRIRIEVEVDWTDTIGATIETQLLLNWPVPQFAGLPVQFSVGVVRVRGVLAVELSPRDPMPYHQRHHQFGVPSMPTESSTGSMPASLPGSQRSLGIPLLYAMITFLHPLELELDVKSLLGHRTKVKDSAKIAQIFSQQIRSVVEDQIVWPNHKIVTLPLNLPVTRPPKAS